MINPVAERHLDNLKSYIQKLETANKDLRENKGILEAEIAKLKAVMQRVCDCAIAHNKALGASVPDASFDFYDALHQELQQLEIAKKIAAGESNE
jgi:hypothetical protein